VFVDGAQMVGAISVAEDLGHVDVLATSDHKFLMNAGRGIGYCYISPEVQDWLTPVNAGWKAGAVPFESFFRPTMDLSLTALRFSNSIGWLAAIGDETALSVFDTFGADVIFGRNRELADLLRSSLAEIGRKTVDLLVSNRSTIVSMPLGGVDPAELLGVDLAPKGLGSFAAVGASRADAVANLAVHRVSSFNRYEGVPCFDEAVCLLCWGPAALPPLPRSQ
jgi:selenocysteine lyase/cysteine desulfurase